MSPPNKIAMPPPNNVVVITDILNEIDDSLALLYLGSLHQTNTISLLSVFTCDLNPAVRAAEASRILVDLLNISDVPVVSGDHPLAANQLVSLALTHNANLTIVVIGELSLLNDACLLNPAAMQGVHTYGFQGTATLDNKNDNNVVPSFDSFNFSRNKPAALSTFQILQSTSPTPTFCFCGKWAAYRIKLRKDDFGKIENPLVRDSLLDCVYRGMQHFRLANPVKFYSIYRDIPLHLRSTDSSDFRWAHEHPLSDLCCPYDPLLCAMLFPPNPPLSSSLKSTLLKITNTKSHYFLGNHPDQHGISDDSVDAVKAQIMNNICNGINNSATWWTKLRIPRKFPNRESPDCDWAAPAASISIIHSRLLHLNSPLLQKKVEVQVSDDNFHFGDQRKGPVVELTLADLFDLSESGNDHFLSYAKSNKQFYATQVELNGGNEIPKSLSIFKLLGLNSTISIEAVNLWFGYMQTHTNPHFDSKNNLLFVCSGKKTVHLQSPNNSDFKTNPIWSVHANHVVEAASTSTSASASPSTIITLEAGEFLFIPEGWFHAVDSVPNTMAINVFFDDDQSMDRLCAENPQLLSFYSKW